MQLGRYEMGAHEVVDLDVKACDGRGANVSVLYLFIYTDMGG